MALDNSNYGGGIWGQKVVTENENVKIVFCSYLRQKWVDLRQTKSKMISGPFYAYRRIPFTNGIFAILVCNDPGEPHVAAAI